MLVPSQVLLPVVSSKLVHDVYCDDEYLTLLLHHQLLIEELNHQLVQVVVHGPCQLHLYLHVRLLDMDYQLHFLDPYHGLYHDPYPRVLQQ